MQCPQCAAACPEGAVFCDQCGTSLRPTCPRCEADARPEARFCAQCGTELTPAPAVPTRVSWYDLVPEAIRERALNEPLESERRLVTVVFADMSGHTRLAGSLDPEDLAELTNDFHAAVAEQVFRFEGWIDNLAGDGMLAVYGAPIAFEDHATRAVLAAHAVVRRVAEFGRERGLGPGFACHVGVATGDVVAGPVGPDLRAKYSMIGDIVNLAQRLSDAAEAGEVFVDGATQRLTAYRFDYEDLGGLALRGFEAPASAYRLVGEKREVGPERGLAGLQSPLVGRDAESGVVCQALERVRAGSGGVLLVLGEAGLGKSRLLADARAATGEGLRWVVGQAASYAASVPFWLFADLTWDAARITPDAPEEEALRRLETCLGAAHRGSRLDDLPYLAHLLGLQLPPDLAARVAAQEPEELRRRTRTAATELVEALAAQQPTVLVLEDLHWADPSSVDLAVALLPAVERAALLIVALMRPERDAPAWRFRQEVERVCPHRCTEVALDALTAEESATLVSNLLPIDDLHPDVRALILRRAEGNPFYVEEVLRGLIEEGLIQRVEDRFVAVGDVGEVHIPETLLAVISARIDRLSAGCRRVLQMASVIGRTFERRVLAHLAREQADLDEALRKVQRAELVWEERRLPEPEYSFRHVLTQEAAYHSILAARRRDWHRETAAYMEELLGERAEEHAALLAHHYLRAEAEPQGLHWALVAADRACATYANEEARRFYGQVLELATRLGDQERRGAAILGLGELDQRRGNWEEAEGQLRQGVELVRDRTRRARAYGLLGSMGACRSYAPGPWEQDYAAAIAEARRLSDAGVAAYWMATYIDSLMVVGRFEEAARWAQEVVALAEQTGDPNAERSALTARTSMDISYLGPDAGTQARAERALALAEQTGQERGTAVGLYQLSRLHFLDPDHRDLEQALECARRGLELARRSGTVRSTLVAVEDAAFIHALRGEYEQTLELMRQSVSLSQGNDPLGTEMGRDAVRLILRKLGRDPSGEPPGVVPGGFEGVWHCAYLATVATHLDEPGWAVEWLRRGLELAEPIGAAHWITADIQLLLALADDPEYQRLYREATGREAQEQARRLRGRRAEGAGLSRPGGAPP